MVVLPLRCLVGCTSSQTVGRGCGACGAGSVPGAEGSVFLLCVGLGCGIVPRQHELFSSGMRGCTRIRVLPPVVTRTCWSCLRVVGMWCPANIQADSTEASDDLCVSRVNGVTGVR